MQMLFECVLDKVHPWTGHYFCVDSVTLFWSRRCHYFWEW